MSSPAAQFAAGIKRAIDEAPRLRLAKVKCLQVSPFLVSIDGRGSVPAMRLAGQTFAVGETGYALVQAPSLPICFKVT